MAVDIGIDLGTANTLIYDKRRGIVLNEPSMVIRSKKNQQLLAIGEEASDMLGRTPDGVQAIRPIRNGVITSFQGTVAMLKHFIKKTVSNSFFRVRTIICVPCGITEVERRAVTEAARNAGAREVYLVRQPLAAAIGCGAPVAEPHGTMLVTVGAGVTEVAVISLGGIVVSHTVRTAGEAFDNAIIQYIKRKYNILAGAVTAEQLKCSIGTVYYQKERERSEINGLDLLSGLPKTVTVNSEELREAMQECADEVIDAVKQTLEQTPPELAADIVESGIILAGGGAKLRGLGRLISVNVDIPVYIAEEPMECAAIGTGKNLDFMAELGQRQRRFL